LRMADDSGYYIVIAVFISLAAFGLGFAVKEQMEFNQCPVCIEPQEPVYLFEMDNDTKAFPFEFTLRSNTKNITYFEMYIFSDGEEYLYRTQED